MNASHNYLRQLLAVTVPATVSVEQALTGGNLLLATLAGILAVLAGVWAYRKQRTLAEVAELDKQIAELKLQRELGRDQGEE